MEKGRKRVLNPGGFVCLSQYLTDGKDAHTCR